VVPLLQQQIQSCSDLQLVFGHPTNASQLKKIDEFGDEVKGKLTTLLAKLDVEDKRRPEKWEEFELVEKKDETRRITSFTFQRPGKGEELDPGCFARLRLPNGLTRAYSLVGGDTHRLQFGVALDDNSRGGSRYLHETIKVGDKIHIGKITEGVPVFGQASNHVL